VSQFTFESANAVAVGTFNIHIFTPGWLKRCGIFDEDGDPQLEFALSRPGFRFRAADKGPSLVVEPNRIEFSTVQPFDCGLLLSKILKRLPETPFVAVGVNVFFSCTLDEGEEFPLVASLPNHVGDEETEGRAVSLRFSPNENQSKLIALEQRGRLGKAFGNYETRSADADVLVDAASKFTESAQEMATLLTKAWNINVDYPEHSTKKD
jgi:hypothetical protein